MQKYFHPMISRLHRTLGFGCIVLASLIALAGHSQSSGDFVAKSTNLFAPGVIIALLQKVNDYQTAHPVMKATDRNWERGTWFTGVMAAGVATGDSRFIDQATRFGESNQWQPGTEKSGANVLTCAQTYLELYFLTTNHAFIEPVILWVNSGRSNTPSGAKVWYLEGGRRYADSLYVGAPPLAMLAKATGNSQYLTWMNDFFWDVQAELFDSADNLFYRDKRFIGATNLHGTKIFWSRGNGWVFASLPRILSALPAKDPSRPRYEALFKQMAAAIAKQQQPDGLWRPNLDDPEDFSMPETSGTGFFCYGMAWGVRNGLLDRATYLPVVRKAWTGLAECVNADGKVCWGQLVGDRPVAVKAEDSHEYITGTFLLAGSEVLRLIKMGFLTSATRASHRQIEPANSTERIINSSTAVFQKYGSL